MKKNRDTVIQNLTKDLLRFFGLMVNQNLILEQSIFVFSIFITLFISSSFWYNNPYLYKEKNIVVFSKLFGYLTFFTIFIFYFLRIINISRLYFLIYLLIITLVFLLFRSQGFISKKIIRENILENFLHIKIGDGYGDEIYFQELFDKSNEIKLFSLNNITKTDIKEVITSYQKSIQFDFILINVDSLTDQIEQSIFDLTSLNKPMMLTITKKHSLDTSALSFRKISYSKLNLYYINSKVQTGFEFILKRVIDCTVSILSLMVFSPLILFVFSIFLFKILNIQLLE